MQETTGVGTKRLNGAKLKVGDVVLTTTTAAISKAIRTATRSDVSHAMVCVENDSVIDATSEGVQARNIQRIFFDDSCAVYVLRLRVAPTDAQLTVIRNFLRGHIGTQYLTKEAIQTVWGGGRQSSNKQFCSRLVAQAFTAAGIDLVDDPNFCSPANLKDSPLLASVPDATVAVSAEEAARWEGTEDIPQMMRDAINAVLDGARAKDKRIQTFDDLHRYLAANPHDDAYLCQLLEDSCYLSVWQHEQAKNPWQYDFVRMSAAPANEMEAYCWKVLANEDAGPNRYVVNRGGYALFSKQTGLRFFHVMADLYELLATLHRTRVEVAAKWLEVHHLVAKEERAFLRPHTPQWFKAQEVWDPPQAAMSRMVTELAGSVDVCSVCGDDPARDYRLEEAQRSAGGVDTLRLCADCLSIRADTGEHFVLIPAEAHREGGTAP